jgi:predicted transposase YbfD/YdcC
LETVVMTALLAMVCGGDDAEAMENWGDANASWLENFLEMPHGVPSQDVFLAVFAALDPDALGEVFRAWVEVLREQFIVRGKHLAVDGKTSRRSHDRTNDRTAIHTVSAWMVEEGVVIGQVQTEQKSNEITAIPELLALLDLRGTTVTLDAMGCQTAIAETIRERGAHYLLSVKDNQPTLRNEVVASFGDADDERPRPQDQPAPLATERWEDVNKDHGRIEERTITVCRDLSWVQTADRWQDIAFIVKATSVRTNVATGAVTTGCRYFIGSNDEATVDEIAALVRGHWAIENRLHWVLDMGFRDDEARHRAGNCARNFATLRHIALDLLKTEPTSKLGVANKRKRAGWDRDYLIHVIAGPRS